VNPVDLSTHAETLACRARAAALQLAAVPHDQRVRAIRAMANGIRDDVQAILDSNARDVVQAQSSGLQAALVERLKLNEKRIDAMAHGVERIAEQPDPIGQIIESRTRADGLLIERRRVPIGVILFIYESRPNVTTDAAALCLKSGNAVILRGGKEASHCNGVLNSIIARALGEAALAPGCVQIVEFADRALVPLLLKQDKHIDLVIPRGGERPDPRRRR
jgi:glutamate-5-semialdehyde dehydrogenase